MTNDEIRIMEAAGCTLVAIDKVKAGWGWYEYIGGARYSPAYWRCQRKGHIESVYCRHGQWCIYYTYPDWDIWSNGKDAWEEEVTIGHMWEVKDTHVWVRIPKKHWSGAYPVRRKHMNLASHAN